MISFLNSGILFLASTIVIPVLIYLFAKKRPKTIVFSSIRFIKESREQQKKRINLRNLLLLLIRMLIILLLVLAVSRPAIRSQKISNSSHPKTGLVIIIDNSYSMNYLVDTQTALEKAKEIALKINTMTNDDDVVFLLTTDKNWNDLNGISTYGKLEEKIINELKPTAQTLSAKDVLETAIKLLSEIHLPNREIIFISDLQQSEFPEKLSVPVFIIPTSNAGERINISCENSKLENEIVSNTLKKTISFELVNYSDSEQNDVIYRLFLDGNTIAEKVTDLLPRQRKTQKFEIEVETEGWHYGYAEVKNERQIFDNRNYFSFYHDAGIRVAVLSDLSKLPPTLEAILEIYTGEDGKYDLINIDDVNSELLMSYDNILIYRRQFSERLEFILNDLSSNNNGILFLADDNLSPEWRQFLEYRFNIQFDRFLHSNSPLPISFINQYHYISKDVKNLNSLRINDFWQASQSSDALMKSGDFPLALEKDKFCLWLFDVASLQNPFLLDNAFPVLAYNSLLFTSQQDRISSVRKVGEPLSGSSLVLPNGKEIRPGRNKYIPESPGIYFVDNKAVAVNLDYSESNYHPITDIAINNLQILAEDWQQNILHSRYGYEIWKFLLILVLILFVLEMLLVKKEENK